MSDYISRADAIEAVENNSYGMGSRASVKAIKALPSADAEFADLPDIPRAYYERIVGNMAHEINMLKEQLESADAVQDDVIKKPRTVRYKLHKPIEYVSIEFDEEETITHIDHYTAYGERGEL